MIIAQRNLTITEGETTHHVPVTLLAPELAGDHWRCRFEIGWPEGVQSGDAGGFDGMQAIKLAMQTIGSFLYMSRYHKAGTLRWGKPGAGYGFPMSRGGRAELIGEDKAEYE